jgi:DNA-binding GntR family transcriptional regulator
MATMTLDPNDGRKPSVQVAEAIKRDIESGKYGPGDRVPSVPELSKSFDVARQTVANAFKVLQDQGYLVSRVGSGTFVRTDFGEVVTEPTLPELAKSVDEMRTRLQRVDESATGGSAAEVQALRDEVAQLRHDVGVLQTQLIDLYGRTGNQYPRHSGEDQDARGFRRAG